MISNGVKKNINLLCYACKKNKLSGISKKLISQGCKKKKRKSLMLDMQKIKSVIYEENSRHRLVKNKINDMRKKPSLQAWKKKKRASLVGM